jgi:heterodisulfide reductase subunit A
MIDAGRHPRIELLTCSEVVGLEGEAGDFTARVLKKSRYIDEKECTGCGECAQNCPVVVPNEFEAGMGARKAVFIPFQQAIPFAYMIDHEACLNDNFIVCERCANSCDKKAIDYDMPDQVLELTVSAVILATGFDELDPTPLRSFGYGIHENVLYSLEFERLTNSTGPTQGRILRPSDQREVQSIGFINCVGSRALRYNPYCSSVCCMFTTKQAMVARESTPDLKSYVFFIDLRAAGKGFRNYVDTAAQEHDIHYIRGRPAKVVEADNQDLIIYYEDTASGKVSRLTVEMVVLATSLIPNRSIGPLSEALGIELNEHHFVKTDPYTPACSSRPGIYVCGFCQGPVGIAESVTMASSAASLAAELALAHVGKEA